MVQQFLSLTPAGRAAISYDQQRGTYTVQRFAEDDGTDDGTVTPVIPSPQVQQMIQQLTDRGFSQQIVEGMDPDEMMEILRVLSGQQAVQTAPSPAQGFRDRAAVVRHYQKFAERFKSGGLSQQQYLAAFETRQRATGCTAEQFIGKPATATKPAQRPAPRPVGRLPKPKVEVVSFAERQSDQAAVACWAARNVLALKAAGDTPVKFAERFKAMQAKRPTLRAKDIIG